MSAAAQSAWARRWGLELHRPVWALTHFEIDRIHFLLRGQEELRALEFACQNNQVAPEVANRRVAELKQTAHRGSETVRRMQGQIEQMAKNATAEFVARSIRGEWV